MPDLTCIVILAGLVILFGLAEAFGVFEDQDRSSGSRTRAARCKEYQTWLPLGLTKIETRETPTSSVTQPPRITTPPQFPQIRSARPTLDPRRYIAPLPTPPTQMTPSRPTPPLNTQATGQGVSANTMIETWRNAVTDLVKLAQQNMEYSKKSKERQDFKAAVEYALTSVENMSRALLHCCGEKADVEAGQIEPLKLAARRFTGEKRARLQTAIETIAKLYQDAVTQKSLSTSRNETAGLNFETANACLDSAFKVVTILRDILYENFN